MSERSRPEKSAKPNTPPSPAPGDVARPRPSEDEIRLRAYYRYLERGERGDRKGTDVEDWLEAEAELGARPDAAAPASDDAGPAPREGEPAPRREGRLTS